MQVVPQNGLSQSALFLCWAMTISRTGCPGIMQLDGTKKQAILEKRCQWAWPNLLPPKNSEESVSKFLWQLSLSHLEQSKKGLWAVSCRIKVMATLLTAWRSHEKWLTVYQADAWLDTCLYFLWHLTATEVWWSGMVYARPGGEILAHNSGRRVFRTLRLQSFVLGGCRHYLLLEERLELKVQG